MKCAQTATELFITIARISQKKRNAFSLLWRKTTPAFSIIKTAAHTHTRIVQHKRADANTQKRVVAESVVELVIAIDCRCHYRSILLRNNFSPFIAHTALTRLFETKRKLDQRKCDIHVSSTRILMSQSRHWMHHLQSDLISDICCCCTHNLNCTYRCATSPRDMWVCMRNCKRLSYFWTRTLSVARTNKRERARAHVCLFMCVRVYVYRALFCITVSVSNY